MLDGPDQLLQTAAGGSAAERAYADNEYTLSLSVCFVSSLGQKKTSSGKEEVSVPCLINRSLYGA